MLKRFKFYVNCFDFNDIWYLKWLVLNRLRKYPPQITRIALEAANLNEITSSLAIMFFALKQNFAYPYQMF